eukprot:gene27179-33865_t
MGSVDRVAEHVCFDLESFDRGAREGDDEVALKKHEPHLCVDTVTIRAADVSSLPWEDRHTKMRQHLVESLSALPPRVIVVPPEPPKPTHTSGGYPLQCINCGGDTVNGDWSYHNEKVFGGFNCGMGEGCCTETKSILQESLLPLTTRNQFAFAALNSSGGVLTWGLAADGGDSSAVTHLL